MRRVAVVFPLLCTMVAAQDAEDLVERILSPKTAPRERIRLIDEVVRDAAGAADLARRALQPGIDPEVVHAVVDGLFENDAYVESLPRICLLLLDGSPPLAEKVRIRIQRVAETPDRSDALRAQLEALARGQAPEAADDPRVAMAAVRALAVVPDRRAVEAIVDVWAAAEGPMRDECRGAVREVLEADTPEKAARELAQRPGWTYFDLVRELSEQRRDQLELQIKELHKYMEEALRGAPPARAFEALANGEPFGREVAARRLRELAEKKEYGEAGAQAFSQRVWEAFQRAVRDGAGDALVGHLMDCLTVLSASEKPPPAEDVARVVGELRDRILASERVGKAAVALLRALKEPGVPLLIDAARNAAPVEVRRGAVLRLRERATDEGADGAAIGRVLAGILASDSAVDVRKSVLMSLRQVPAAEAVPHIEALLLPSGESAPPPLIETEVQDAIYILGQLAKKAGSQPARALLRRVASEHPKSDVRVAAVADGLLPAPGPEGEADRRWIEETVLDGEQPVDLRRRLVEALGAKGGRDCESSLARLAEADLPDELKAAVTAARFELARRLAAGNPLAREDLDAAVRILNALAPSQPPEEVEKLARTILNAADGAKMPAGRARYHWALCVEGRQGVAPGEVLARFKLAMERAAGDGLGAETERDLLGRYRKLLEADGSPDRLREALQVLERLAALNESGPSRGAEQLVAAAEIAAGRLKDRGRAQSLLDRAKPLVPAETPLAQRCEDLQRSIDALPASG